MTNPLSFLLILLVMPLLLLLLLLMAVWVLGRSIDDFCVKFDILVEVESSCKGLEVSQDLQAGKTHDGPATACAHCASVIGPVVRLF